MDPQPIPLGKLMASKTEGPCPVINLHIHNNNAAKGDASYESDAPTLSTGPISHGNDHRNYEVGPVSSGNDLRKYDVHSVSDSNNVIGDGEKLKSDDLKGYADEVERIAGQDRVRTGVDEYTEAQIKLQLEKLKGLLDRAKGSEKVTQFSRDTSADAQKATLGASLARKEQERDAIVDGESVNKYVTQSRFGNKGLLGTMAQPNDGSGTAMIARKELMNRLLSKSLKGNSGDAEMLKLRSQEPNQKYPGVEDD